MDDKKIRKSKKIHKETGKTFYFATKLFPKDIRQETYILYAFFRKADDVVDTQNPDDKQSERLEEFRRVSKGIEETNDPILEAFNTVRKNKNISGRNIDSFIDAMKMDINKTDYETYDELEEYMDGSAASVGRMMTEIINPDEEKKAIKHATSLGIAFQMTNFIRDVGEDIDKYNRVYLPKDTMNRYNVTRDDIENKNLTDNFKNVLEKEMQRTEEIYEHGVKGIRYLPEKTQFPIFLSSVFYSDYHRMIREKNYDVLNNQHDISTRRKLELMARSYWVWNRKNSSPFEAFKSVSEIYGNSGKNILEHSENNSKEKA